VGDGAKIRAMAQERTDRLSASPPMFQSRFLDFFTRVHPTVPALIYVPVVGVCVWLGLDDGLSAGTTALLVLAGLVIWTPTEYWLHRGVPLGAQSDRLRMHFIIHGVHHDQFNDDAACDDSRASIPPALSRLFWLISPPWLPHFAGFFTGI
jgi:hypothetical protein